MDNEIKKLNEKAEEYSKILEKILPDGADGEIISGKTFQSSSSAVMSMDKEVTFTYNWFDFVISSLEEPYKDRVNKMKEFYEKLPSEAASFISLIYPIRITSEKELLSLEEKYLDQGYEGVMIRDPEGKYKCGRSTVREGILLKLKRFEDSEMTITGFVEMCSNTNEATKDAFGRTKRSSKKEGMVPIGSLGKFIGEDKKRFPGEQIEIGTGEGLTLKLRKKIWESKSDYLGKVIKYKFQKQGMKNKPRFPIFLGFRSKNDM